MCRSHINLGVLCTCMVRDDLNFWVAFLGFLTTKPSGLCMANTHKQKIMMAPMTLLMLVLFAASVSSTIGQQGYLFYYCQVREISLIDNFLNVTMQSMSVTVEVLQQLGKAVLLYVALLEQKVPILQSPMSGLRTTAPLILWLETTPTFFHFHP